MCVYACVCSGSVVGVAQEQYSALTFSIFVSPSYANASGFASVYEDDGASVAYLSGEYAYTTCTYTFTSETQVRASQGRGN